MVRNWDTIKALLARFEEESIETFIRDLGELPGDVAVMDRAQREKLAVEQAKTESLVFGHLQLLLDAGYVEGVTVRPMDDGFGYGFNHPRLTMAGHDALEAMRSKTVWSWVKNQAETLGIPITVELIQQALARTS